jgi:hypothetical protein
MLMRLEDFISLARKGEEVDLSVTLNKQIFTRKFDPYTTGDPEDEIDMYMLSADYSFTVGGRTVGITKFYASGIEGESQDDTRRNIYIANERLIMDYNRLKEAKIVFVEKFWDEKLWGTYY